MDPRSSKRRGKQALAESVSNTQGGKKVRISSKLGILFLAALLLIIPLLAACSDDDETEEPTATVTPTQSPTTEPTIEPTDVPTVQPTPAEDVVITLGNLTDFTGPAAVMMLPVDTALADMVRYFNEENLIPGVRLKIESYDGQMDPSKDLSGYEWLKERGADVIVCTLPGIALSLHSVVSEDEIPLFSLSAADAVAKDTPGWSFLMNTQTDAIGYTYLKWIADNHWDWETNGPATIGGASWIEPWSEGIMRGMEEYANAHPEQFEWIAGFLGNYNFTWGPEVAALKDADYVMPAVTGAGFLGFVREYSQAGGKGHFICNEGNTAALPLITEAGAWDLIDGSLIIQANRAFSEGTELTDLMMEVTARYHDDPEGLLRKVGRGNFLGSWRQWYGILTLIKTAVENAGGAQNFTTQALYDTANNYSMSWEGVPEWNWAPDKRSAWNAMALYEFQASTESVIPYNGEEPVWLPIIYEP